MLSGHQGAKKAVLDLESRLDECGKEILAQLDSSIEAIERYKANPKYLENLIQHRDSVRRTLKDLRAKTNLLF